MTGIYSRAAFAVFFTAALASAQRGTPIPQQLVFAPYHASGIYDVGEIVGWTVTPGPVEPTYSYKWTIRRNNAETLKEGKLDLSSGKDKIEITGDGPEMIYVAIEPVVRLAAEGGTPAAPAGTTAGARRGNAGGFVGGNTGRNNGLYAVGAAVSPTKIGLSTPRPADFDSFWDAKLAAQATVPMNPVLTSVETDIPGVELNTFVVAALASNAQGYIARPAKDGKFPALLLLQYAGVYALNAHSVAARAAEGWLVMDVDSHDKLPSDPAGSIPRNYAAVGNTDRETSYFLNMYLRDSRALDYLMTRPDWNGRTIVLMGTSMGGQQSIVLAGLRPENITAVLVCVPSGTDANGELHGRKTGYPNWPSNDPAVMKTALYFDPINFASRIKAPVLAAIGFIDTTSPPAGIWTALNQISVAKEPLPMIESEHNNLTPQKEQNWDARSKELLGILLNGGVFKPNELRYRLERLAPPNCCMICESEEAMHEHSRRGFLAQSLNSIWMSATLMEQAFFRATLARAQAPAASTNVFNIEKVAEGVYAAIPRPAGITNCNSVIFENAHDLLVVDTHSRPSAVAALVAQIRKEVSPKPIRYVVETHFHWDHTQGAPQYRRLAPSADLIATTSTRDLIAEFGSARLKASLDEIPASIDRFQQRLATAKTAEDRAYYQKMVSDLRGYLAEMRGWTPELPNLTFSDNLVLHDKAHDLHLAFRGRGHTAGDVVVYCPQKKVLATGDLVHGWLPYIHDAYPREWPVTIETAGKFDFVHLIGGHGAVQHSRERMGQFAGYIRELTEAVDAGKRKGQTIGQLQAAITPASLKSLAGGYGDFVSNQITRYDGPQMRVSPADALANAVKANIPDVFTALER